MDQEKQGAGSPQPIRGAVRSERRLGDRQTQDLRRVGADRRSEPRPNRLGADRCEHRDNALSQDDRLVRRLLLLKCAVPQVVVGRVPPAPQQFQPRARLLARTLPALSQAELQLSVRFRRIGQLDAGVGKQLNGHVECAVIGTAGGGTAPASEPPSASSIASSMNSCPRIAGINRP